MINVSNDFKNLMQERTDFKENAEITLTDGTVLELSEDDFTVSNNSVTDAADANTIPLGVAISRNIQIELMNDDDHLSSYDFFGAKIRHYLTYQLNEINLFSGRNLALQSKNFTVGDEYWSISSLFTRSVDSDGFTVMSISHSGATNTVWARLIPHRYIPVEDMGKGITVSFDFMCDSVAGLDQGCICALQTYNADGVRIGWYESQNILTLKYTTLDKPLEDGVWVRATVKFTEAQLKKVAVSGYTEDDVSYTSVSFNLVKNGSIHFKKVKIEYGSVATEYTEAPEDIRIEKIEYGTFTVNSPETYGTTVIINANDDMYKADKAYSTNISFPATIKAMLIDACSTCGIPLLSTSFLNDDFIVAQKPSGDYTFRQIFGYIAMLAGGNARISRQGYLEIISYNFDFDTQAYHDFTEWINLTLDTSDITITGIQTTYTTEKTVVDSEGNESIENEDITILDGTEDYVISVENPLISGKEQTAVSLIAEVLKGATFRKFEGDYVGYPIAEFMDLVKITDWKGNVYNSFLTDINFTFFGTTNLKNSAEAGTRNNSLYPSNAMVVFAKSRKLIEQEKTNREVAIERLSKSLAESSGMYITSEVQPDGSSIYYMHNKPTLAESDIIWKLTAEAFGISTDGGKTYPYGFTITGEMITRLLYAEGINADYISTGAISVKDSDGNIIFSVDMDSKSVYMSGDYVRIGGKTATTAINDALSESKDYSDGKLADYANTVTANITNLQSQIDGAIETFFYDYEPSLQNIPASEWTTTEERKKHEGDLFYWKSKGYAYRFFQDGATWKWQLVQDTDITQAMAAAEKAQDTADGKRRVFVVTPQPPYDIGDLWTNGTDILTCAVARAQGSVYVSSDWQKLNKYTDDSFAQQVQENLDNLQIGGRNIILNSTFNDGDSDWSFAGVSSKSYEDYDTQHKCLKISFAGGASGYTGSYRVYQRPFTATNIDTDYIISFFAKADAECTLWFGQANSSGTGGMHSVTLTTEWTYYTMAHNPNTNAFCFNTGTAGVNIYLSKIKVERGNISTDWTPAPEDTKTYADNLAADLQSQIDGKIETYNQTSDPSTSWTTTELKTQHTGDLWYNGNTKETKRWSGTAWVKLENKEAEEASTLAQTKAQVFTVTPTVPYYVGDLWFNSATSDIMTCVTARTTGSYTASDWAKRNKYTDDTVAKQALEEAQNARNLNIILDNDYQGIPTDHEGNYTTFPTVQTSVQAFYGQTDVTSDCSYSITKSTGLTGSFDTSTHIYTVTGLTTDTGWVDITASYLSLFTTTKRFNVAKIKGGSPGEQGTQGKKGDPGTDGVVYILDASTNIIKKGESLEPSYIEYNSYYRLGGNAERIPFLCIFKIEETADGNNWKTVYQSESPESSVIHNLYTALVDASGRIIVTADGKFIGTSRDVIGIKCTIYSSDGLNILDVQTATVVRTVESLTQEEIFNFLTENGTIQGLFKVGNEIYFNGEYIKANTITADKLNINELSALGATIGGWNIRSDAIFKDIDVDGVTYRVWLQPPNQISKTDTWILSCQKKEDVGFTGTFMLCADGTAFFGDTIITPDGSATFGNTTIYSDGSAKFGDSIIASDGTVKFGNTYIYPSGFMTISAANITTLKTVSIESSYFSHTGNFNGSSKAPNLYTDEGGGDFYVTSSSSEKIKTDIEDIDVNSDISPKNLYNAKIRQFKYKKDILPQEDSRYMKNMPGFIVEELEEVCPIAIDYDENGEPYMWNYKILIPQMLYLIQEQKKQLDKQQKQIDYLLNKRGD